MGWPVEPSYAAGGTIAPCRFVVGDPSVDEQILQASVQGQPCMGIMQEGQRGVPGLTGSDAAVAAIVGDQNFKVHAHGDVCLLEAGGTFNAFAELMCDTSGKGILATSGYYVAAIALQAGINGRKVRVQIHRYQKSISGSSNQ